jgi:hypothetical protein
MVDDLRWRENAPCDGQALQVDERNDEISPF